MIRPDDDIFNINSLIRPDHIESGYTGLLNHTGYTDRIETILRILRTRPVVSGDDEDYLLTGIDTCHTGGSVEAVGRKIQSRFRQDQLVIHRNNNHSALLSSTLTHRVLTCAKNKWGLTPPCFQGVYSMVLILVLVKHFAFIF